MAKLLISFLLGLATISFAEQVVDNGGDVVVCEDETILLDYYEGRILRDFTVDLGDASDPVERAKVAVDRLLRLDQKRAQRYREALDQFPEKSLLRRGIRLADLPDSGHIVLPKDCRLEQIVIQKPLRFAEDKQYYVNGDLWDKLKTDQKAGLLLHEIIFADFLGRLRSSQHHAIDARQKRVISRVVRYFSSYLSSRRFDDLTPEDYERIFDAEITELNGSTDMLVCEGPNTQDRLYTHFDIYEGRSIRNIRYTGGSDSNSLIVNMQLLLARIKRLDPVRAVLYEKWFEEFRSDAVFLAGVELVDYPDSVNIGLPQNCGIEQLVIQRETNVEQDRRYIFNADLWTEIGSANQAAALLHEFIYRELYTDNPTPPKDSTSVRYLASMIWSDRLETMEIQEYQQLLTMVGLSGIRQIGPYKFFMGSVTFFPDNTLASGNLAEVAILDRDRLPEIKIGCDFDKPYDPFNKIEFHQNGVLSGGCLAEYNFFFDRDGSVRSASALTYIRLDESGRLIGARPVLGGL